MIVVNIVFDLGGVVLRWQPEAIIAKVFAEPQERSRVRSAIVEHPDWQALDRGTLRQVEAVVRGAKRTGLSEARVSEFLRRVPLELAPIPGTIDLMYRLQLVGHKLFCLSNIHASFIDHLEKAHTFWEVFSGTVISCRVHLCKPESAIYAHLLTAYALRAPDTVFIDDVDVNLTAAAAFSMHTIKFQNPAQCEAELQALGCL